MRTINCYSCNKRTLWKAVGTQTSSMALHRAACSGVSRSVSNMVRPMVYMAAESMPALCGGQAVVWNNGCGTDQAPAHDAGNGFQLVVQEGAAGLPPSDNTWGGTLVVLTSNDNLREALRIMLCSHDTRIKQILLT